MYKPHHKPRPKSKTSDISKQSPSPLHHTFLLGRARFTAQPLSALGKTNKAMSSRFSTRGQKPLLCIRNGMFSYMVGLNGAESFFVDYSDYEIVQKNVERMVRNNSIFVTIFYRFGPLFELPK